MNKNPSFEFFIAGVQFHQANTVLNDMLKGHQLKMVSEPTNKYDPNAVQLIFQLDDKSTMLGYVPKKFSASVSAFLEYADNPICTLTEVNKTAKKWEQLKVIISDGDLEEETEDA